MVGGSYLRADTLYCSRGGGLAGPKTDRPCHKDRRVQTITGESPFRPSHLQRTFLRTASQFPTVIERIAPSNGGIPLWEDQVRICASWTNGGQENMIVDTWLKIGIREENTHVNLGKQLNGTRLPLAMSPTSCFWEPYARIEEYELKVSIISTVDFCYFGRFCGCSLPEKNVSKTRPDKLIVLDL